MEKIGSPIVLGTESISRLLKQYAVPSVIAMIASSLYNITDSIFIGQGAGPLALSGLAITFPLMNLGAAFGSLIGAGASALMSLRLGQKDYSSANNILGNVFLLNLILGTAYSLVVLLFLEPILTFFGASQATLPFARDYMIIIILGNVVTHLYFGLNAMLRATGKPKVSMLSTIFSVLINAILTPLFIFRLGWGIKGAAVATVIAQLSMLIWQISIFSNKKNFVHLQAGSFHLKKKIVTDSLSIGMAPFMMNAAMSAIVIVINQGLSRHGGDLAVGAYGIINRIIMLIPMVIMGLNQGMQPIAGYNYGAQRFDRVKKVLRLTIFMATLVSTIGFVVGECFPRAVVSIFTRDKVLIDLAVQGLKTVTIFFPIVGFQMVTSNFFQSIGMTGKAIYLSLTRQVLFLLPGLIILPHFFGLMGIWYSMPLADVLSSINAGYILITFSRKTQISQ